MRHSGAAPAFQHLQARAVDAETAAHSLRKENEELRERLAVYAQVIGELRTELDHHTENASQRNAVRSLPNPAT